MLVPPSARIHILYAQQLSCITQSGSQAKPFLWHQFIPDSHQIPACLKHADYSNKKAEQNHIRQLKFKNNLKPSDSNVQFWKKFELKYKPHKIPAKNLFINKKHLVHPSFFPAFSCQQKANISIKQKGK